MLCSIWNLSALTRERNRAPCSGRAESQPLVQFSSVAQSCLTLQSHEPQHARPPCPSPTPGTAWEFSNGDFRHLILSASRGMATIISILLVRKLMPREVK